MNSENLKFAVDSVGKLSVKTYKSLPSTIQSPKKIGTKTQKKYL